MVKGKGAWAGIIKWSGLSGKAAGAILAAAASIAAIVTLWVTKPWQHPDAAQLSQNAVIVAEPHVLKRSAAQDGKWAVTVTGSGFNGDNEVNIRYPTLLVIQPQPASQPNPYLCPPGQPKPVALSAGTFKSVLQVTTKLPNAKYRIYVEGATSRQKEYATIYVGPVPARTPQPAPLSSSPSPSASPEVSCPD